MEELGLPAHITNLPVSPAPSPPSVFLQVFGTLGWFFSLRLLTFWQCCLNKEAVFTVQRFYRFKVCVWRGQETADVGWLVVCLVLRGCVWNTQFPNADTDENFNSTIFIVLEEVRDLVAQPLLGNPTSWVIFFLLSVISVFQPTKC